MYKSNLLSSKLSARKARPKKDELGWQYKDQRSKKKR